MKSTLQIHGAVGFHESRVEDRTFGAIEQWSGVGLFHQIGFGSECEIRHAERPWSIRPLEGGYPPQKAWNGHRYQRQTISAAKAMNALNSQCDHMVDRLLLNIVLIECVAWFFTQLLRALLQDKCAPECVILIAIGKVKWILKTHVYDHRNIERSMRRSEPD
jgi:hypothetical protein